MADRFDAFISYDWQDRLAVEAVAEALRQEGLKVFLDRWYLQPGAPWLNVLSATLRASGAVIVFLGRHRMEDWQQREVCLALELQNRDPKLPVIPVLLPGSEPALDLLVSLTWIDLRNGIDDQFQLRLLATVARREPLNPVVIERLKEVRRGVCPFRALEPFREEDHRFFFGRERSTADLTDSVHRRPVVALFGASGSGKSSLIRAGLLPQLRQGSAKVWEVVIFEPTTAPSAGLARVLLPLLDPTGIQEWSEERRLEEEEGLAQNLRRDPSWLGRVVGRILEHQSGTDRLLIVLDKAEDLFSGVVGTASRQRFTHSLREAVGTQPVSILFSLRAEFLGRLLEEPRLGDLIADALVPVPLMRRAELERTITGPAQRVELRFEDGLVEQILDEAGEEPGSLPLLQYTLTRLWENLDGERQVRRHHYRTVGGVNGSISQRAEEEYLQLAPPEQEAVCKLFCRLVWVKSRVVDGQGASRELGTIESATEPTPEDQYLRQPAALEDLGTMAEKVVQRFVTARLLVTGRRSGSASGVVELAHEVLIDRWLRFKKWLGQHRQFLLWRQELQHDLDRWQRSGHDRAALLRGAFLREAVRQFEQRGDELGRNEVSFIRASLSRRQRLHLTGKAAVGLLAAGLIVWLGWWRSDSYQVTQAKKLAPLAQVAAQDRFDLATDWVVALAHAGDVSGALEGLRTMKGDDLPEGAAEKVVEALAEAGLVVEAQSVAEERWQESERIKLLVAIGRALTATGRGGEAAVLLRVAAAEALSLSGPDSLELVSTVAQAQAEAGFGDEALTTTMAMSQELPRAAILAAVAARLAQNGDAERARRALGTALAIVDAASEPGPRFLALAAMAGSLGTTEGVDVESKILPRIQRAAEALLYNPERSEALTRLVHLHLERKHFDAAWAIAEEVSYYAFRAEAYAAIGRAEARTSRSPESAKEAFRRALQAAKEVNVGDHRRRRDEALSLVAAALLETGSREEALELLPEIRGTGYGFFSSELDDLLRTWAEELAQQGKTAEVAALIKAARWPTDIAPPAAWLAAAHGVAGGAAAARKVIAGIDLQGSDQRESLLKSLGPLVRAGRVSTALEILKTALAIKPEPTDLVPRSTEDLLDPYLQTLTDLAAALAEEGAIDKAIEVAGLLNENDDLVEKEGKSFATEAFGSIARRVLKAGSDPRDLDRTLAAIEALPKPFHRFIGYWAVAEALDRIGRAEEASKVLGSALAEAHSISFTRDPREEFRPSFRKARLWVKAAAAGGRLENALALTAELREPSRSQLRAAAAVYLATEGSLFHARRLAERCADAGDKLSALTAVVSAHARATNPLLRRHLDNEASASETLPEIEPTWDLEIEDRWLRSQTVAEGRADAGRTRPPLLLTSQRPVGRVGYQGVLILRASLDRAGTITHIQVLHASGSDEKVRQKGITAFSQYRFQPALLDGEPTPSHYDQIFNFRQF